MSDFDGPERRNRIRFPIELGAHYTVDGRNGISGTGQTVNISSNGVLIARAVRGMVIQIKIGRNPIIRRGTDG